jgi:mannose-6-phosphate isomerase-like protein (cupin superfamily)
MSHHRSDLGAQGRALVGAGAAMDGSAGALALQQQNGTKLSSFSQLEVEPGEQRNGDLMRLSSKSLSGMPDAVAPDGSEVRLLGKTNQGSLAHFTLPPKAVSRAMAHHTVEEIWYFLAGQGRMWRRLGSDMDEVEVGPGVSITLPVRTHFQFRSDSSEPLVAVAVTMPPWPGDEEAYAVEGPWQATR